MPSSLGLLRIEQAQLDDLAVVLDMLAEAARWLQIRQIQQSAYPPPVGLRAKIAGEISKGEVYLSPHGAG